MSAINKCKWKNKRLLAHFNHLKLDWVIEMDENSRSALSPGVAGQSLTRVLGDKELLEMLLL